MPITKSRRTKFTACHLTPATKEELKDTAKRLQMSMSELASVAIEEKLTQLDKPAADEEK